MQSECQRNCQILQMFFNHCQNADCIASQTNNCWNYCAVLSWKFWRAKQWPEISEMCKFNLKLFLFLGESIWNFYFNKFLFMKIDNFLFHFKWIWMIFGEFLWIFGNFSKLLLFRKNSSSWFIRLFRLG